MSKKVLVKGNVALCEGAIAAGLRSYFGYPITPQNEVPAYLSRKMVELNRVFVQAESEIAAANMVLGAAVTGARAMTSSSSPGISLKQEAISYMAGMQPERRPGPWKYFRSAVGLFSGGKRRRARRLQADSACPEFRPGNV